MTVQIKYVAVMKVCHKPGSVLFAVIGNYPPASK